MSPLGRNMLATGLLGDPAGDLGTGPQAAARCRTGYGLGQFLLLASAEQGRRLRRSLLEAPIAEAGRAVLVVATDDAAGIIDVQTNQGSGSFDRLVVGDQGEQLPAPSLHEGRGVTRARAQFGRSEMWMEGEFPCHAPA
jgi:hypothetical protein